MIGIREHRQLSSLGNLIAGCVCAIFSTPASSFVASSHVTGQGLESNHMMHNNWRQSKSSTLAREALCLGAQLDIAPPGRLT